MESICTIKWCRRVSRCPSGISSYAFGWRLPVVWGGRPVQELPKVCPSFTQPPPCAGTRHPTPRALLCGSTGSPSLVEWILSTHSLSLTLSFPFYSHSFSSFWYLSVFQVFLSSHVCPPPKNQQPRAATTHVLFHPQFPILCLPLSPQLLAPFPAFPPCSCFSRAPALLAPFLVAFLRA